MSRVKETAHLFHIGDAVRIKVSIRSPYAGQAGTVCQIESSEGELEYLVRFSDGLAFRYTGYEMELATVAA
jgi:hypothetical protein